MSTPKKDEGTKFHQLDFAEFLDDVTPTEPRFSASVVPQTTFIVTTAKTGARERAPTPSQSSTSADARALYPHLYEDSAGGGQAMMFIRLAKQDAGTAAAACSEGRFDEVSTRVGQIAASMRAAHPHTSFNEALGAAVSYIRRAASLASVSELTTPSLLAMQQCLQRMSEDPMIDLDTVAKLIDVLESRGWQGEHAEVGMLVRALLSGQVDTAEAQVGATAGA